jgi:hypothetical protein
MPLTLDRDGAQLFPNLLSSDLLAGLETILSSRPPKPGVRIRGDPELSDWVSRKSPLGQLASTCLGAEAQPVRAILFDKNSDTNWALGWHQDRTVAVSERIEVEGYGNWTSKAGTAHVEPPFAVLERMITVRVHLDDVDSDNGPLLIVPGSHRLGRLIEAEIGSVVETGSSVACLARAGNVWVYARPILHASEASRRATKRRVLQIDFSAEHLPGGLRWAGIGST